MGLFGRGKSKAAVPLPTAPDPHEGKKTVVIVDDDMTIADLEKTVFVGRPWRVHTAYSGVAALSLVNTERPDLVLLDLMLPDIPGEKVIDSLKASRAPTKVIVVTGRFVTMKDFAGWQGIVVFVLRKPYELAELRRLVEAVESGQEIRPKLSEVGDA